MVGEIRDMAPGIPNQDDILRQNQRIQMPHGNQVQNHGLYHGAGAQTNSNTPVMLNNPGAIPHHI